MHSDPALVATLGRTSRLAAGLAASLGAFSLGLWAAGLGHSTAVSYGWTVVNPASALCLLMLALALLTRTELGRLAKLLSVVPLLVAVTVLFDRLAGTRFGLDAWLFPEQLAGMDARVDMIVPTAVCVLLVAASILVRDGPSAPRARAVASDVLAVVPGLVALHALVAYASMTMAAIPTTQWPMSLVIALAVEALVVGTVCAPPVYGLLADAVRPGPGGRVLRGLLPVLLLAPVVLVAMNAALGASGMDVVVLGQVETIALAMAFTVWIARSLTRDDEAHARTRLEVADRDTMMSTLLDATYGAQAWFEQERLVQINEEGLRMLRARHADEVLGGPILRFVHPEDRHLSEQRLAKVEQGEAVPLFETRLSRLDGSFVDVELLSLQARREGRPAILVVARDVSQRKALEAAFKESNERFETMFRSASVGLWTTDLRGRFLTSNPTVHTILGRSADELLGAHLATVVHPDDMSHLLPAFLQLAEGQRDEVRENYRVKRADGSTRWVAGAVWLIRDAKGDPSATLGMIVDTTDRRQAEEDVRRLSQRLQAVYESAPIGIATLDLQGLVTMWNPAAEQIFGWKEAEVVGRPLPIVSPGSVETFYEDMNRLRRGEVVAWHDVQPVRKDGSVLDIRVWASPLLGPDGSTADVLLLYEDVTERRQVTRALQESERRLRAIVENTTDAIHIKDLDGRYVFANRVAAEVVAGLPVERMLHRQDRELYQPDTAAQIAAADARVLDTGEPETFEIVMKSLSGRSGVYLSTKFPFRSASGDIGGVIGMARDITERKRLEEQVRAQYERVVDLDRRRTELVNAVSHDLRSPLATISGFGELLHDELSGSISAEQDGYVVHILDATKRLQGMVDDMLDFARLESGTFQLVRDPTDFVALASEIVGSFRPQAQADRIRLGLVAPDEPVPISVDAKRMQRVLANLLDNALKFTPTGGSVEVRITAEDDAVCCVVQDTGPGISAEDQQRLFRRFSQLDGGRKGQVGLGLGLSICKSLVEAHGGTIGVRSEPGHGSAFWFELPFTPR